MSLLFLISFFQTINSQSSIILIGTRASQEYQIFRFSWNHGELVFVPRIHICIKDHKTRNVKMTDSFALD